MRAGGRFTATFDILDADMTRDELKREEGARAHLALKDEGIQAMWELCSIVFYPHLKKLVLSVPTVTRITQRKHIEC